MHYHSTLRTWHLYNERVIVRADLNVPLENNTILDDIKLKTLQPTLDYLIQQQVHVITLLTHIGDPKKEDPHYSTRLLIPWFIQHNYAVIYAATVQEISPLFATIPKGTIIICENMRFFPQEKGESLQFAHALKQCGDFYINDGFATMHRAETSITLLPTLFEKDKKTIGFYTEHELACIDTIMHKAKKPIVTFIGGKKIKSKLAILYDLLNVIDVLVLCPALSFTFLKAQGYDVGQSLVDETVLDQCNALYDAAKKRNVKIIMPLDFYVSHHGIKEPYYVAEAHAIPSNAIGISIGPRTINFLGKTIQKAGTIIYNGAMGFLENPSSLESMRILMQTITKSDAQTLITGGDTTAIMRYFNMQSLFTHISLGGGATLFYIAYKTLPGLQALNK